MGFLKLLILLLGTATPLVLSANLLQSVAEGVYVAFQSHDDRFNDCNVTVIVRSDHLMLIDAPSSATFTEALIGEISAFKKPVRYIVNTHWHEDHTQSNALYRNAFGQRLTIIGHRSLLADIPQRAQQDHNDRVNNVTKQIPLAQQQLAKGLSLSGRALSEEEQENQQLAIDQSIAWLETNRKVQFVTPDISYETGLLLEDEIMPIELIHAKAHTRGDTLVYLKPVDVLIAGDVVDEVPFAGHGYPDGWRQTLLRIKQDLKPRLIIPGHGAAFKPEDINPLLQYFESLVHQVRAGIDRGDDLKKIQLAVDVANERARLVKDDSRAQRFFDSVLNEAIERAFIELNP